MTYQQRFGVFLSGLVMGLVLGAQVLAAGGAADQDLKVYKDPNCGCCGRWVDHMRESGFKTVPINTDRLAALKAEQGIPLRYQSCHTAVYADKYVFEGHIPAFVVERFLADPPAGARGLVVPAMPVGSPGMEVGEKFAPYQVLLLKQDGSTVVYATINDRQEQYQ